MRTHARAHTRAHLVQDKGSSEVNQQRLDKLPHRALKYIHPEDRDMQSYAEPLAGQDLPNSFGRRPRLKSLEERVGTHSTSNRSTELLLNRAQLPMEMTGEEVVFVEIKSYF